MNVVPLAKMLRVLVLSTIAWNIVPPALAVAAERPNIIVIFTDDQGYNDLGCFGSKTIKTPHLDRMAAEGLRLTSFYAQPVCGVSRAALMTGSYPIRVGEPGNRKRLHTVPHPREITMAEVLKRAGYATGMLGKWHLTLRNPNGPGGFDPTTMPNAQGFDDFYGTPLFNGFTVFVNDTKFRSPILRNQEVVVEAVESWDDITQDYTREALAWIEKHRQGPFFLYLAHNLPHIPVGASPEFKGKSAYGPYGDTIEEIDWSCGQILAKLKELELDENTLVVFTSDNGPWVETTRAMQPDGKPFIPRDHSGSADPLRGWKMSAWDGGSRVPCIVRWPGRVPQGRVSDELLSTMDLLPTFAKLAGAKLDEDVTLDGLDAASFLLGKSDASPRDEYLYYAGCLLTGVRSGKWKLVLPRKANPSGTGWWGRMIEAVPQTQLFNLDDDPAEATNLAMEHPETVAALMKRIERARTELGDIDRTGSGVRLFDEGPRRLEVPLRGRASAPIVYDKAKPLGNLRFTFEAGDLEKWRLVEGKLDPVTNRKQLPNHPGQPFNKQGEFFLFTGNHRDQQRGNDSLTGVLESPVFVLKGDRMSFLVGGGSGKDTYVALCDDQGRELMKAHGKNGPALHRVTWNVAPHRGSRLKLRLVDRSQGGWGHVTFDDFSCEGDVVEE